MSSAPQSLSTNSTATVLLGPILPTSVLNFAQLPGRAPMPCLKELPYPVLREVMKHLMEPTEIVVEAKENRPIKYMVREHITDADWAEMLSTCIGIEDFDFCGEHKLRDGIAVNWKGTRMEYETPYTRGWDLDETELTTVFLRRYADQRAPFAPISASRDVVSFCYPLVGPSQLEAFHNFFFIRNSFFFPGVDQVTRFLDKVSVDNLRKLQTISIKCRSGWREMFRSLFDLFSKCTGLQSVKLEFSEFFLRQDFLRSRVAKMLLDIPRALKRLKISFGSGDPFRSDLSTWARDVEAKATMGTQTRANEVKWEQVRAWEQRRLRRDTVVIK